MTRRDLTRHTCAILVACFATGFLLIGTVCGGGEDTYSGNQLFTNWAVVTAEENNGFDMSKINLPPEKPAPTSSPGTIGDPDADLYQLGGIGRMADNHLRYDTVMKNPTTELTGMTILVPEGEGYRQKEIENSVSFEIQRYHDNLVKQQKTSIPKGSVQVMAELTMARQKGLQGIIDYCADNHSQKTGKPVSAFTNADWKTVNEYALMLYVDGVSSSAAGSK